MDNGPSSLVGVCGYCPGPTAVQYWEYVPTYLRSSKYFALAPKGCESRTHDGLVPLEISRQEPGTVSSWH
jgi:hypothetical protein